MALVHQKLYESGDLSLVNLRRYLPDLCDYLVSACSIEPNSIAPKNGY
jgi:two-component sensor histidine kinase